MGKRIFMVGATGTIGRATLRVLVERGHDILCFARPGADIVQAERAEWRFGDVTDPESVARDGFCGQQFDIVLSCLASRSGVPRDAWAIDHRAHMNILAAARKAGVAQFIQLSAICVQRPRLAFQFAKLAFEQALIDSGIAYSIVRPTAYFKSLSGQVERVRQGKAFLLFGNGRLTACKPISDRDLALYLADCIDDPARRDRILPIGGPGEAITPRQQGEMLFSLLGKEPRFRQVPLWLIDAIVAGLSAAGRIIPAAADKAELARIGRYYASESMLLLDPESGAYNATATPATGSDTLLDHYRQMIDGDRQADLGAHSIF